MFERAFQEDIERPQSLGDAGFAVSPPVSDFAVQVPQATPADNFAVSPPASYPIDTAAYGAANPDLGYYFANSPEQQALYGNLDAFLQRHYDTTGINENRPGVQTLAVKPPPSGIPNRPTVAPTAVPSATPTVTDPFAVQSGATPNFGMYGSSAGEYVAPQLQAANDRFSTPYYAAYTNDGDLAGAVMVGENQKVRLVDGKTGQVVFEGVGPAAAQQAVGIANAVSEDKGRKAAWAIQADYGPEKGWVSQAAERYDPKKSGVFGTLLDIAAPILLNALLPGLGGALAGALGTFGGTAAMAGLANLGSGLIQGESLGTALKGAAISGLTSATLNGALDKFPNISNAVNGVMRPINNAANSLVDASGLRAVLDPINNGLVHVVDSAGNVVHTLQGGVDAAKDWIHGVGDKVVSGIDSTFAPGVTSGGVTTVAPLTVSPMPTMNFGIPTPGLGVSGGAPTVTDIEGLTVSPERPAQPGVTGPDGVTTVEGLEVRPERPVEQPGFDPGVLAPDGVVDVAPVTVMPPPVVPDPGIPTPSLPTPVSPTDLDGLTVMPPPTQDPGIVTTVPPVIPPVVNPGIPSTGGQSTGSGKYSINSNAGTRASLSPIFSASLPAPTFGTRTPRAVDIDQRYAIERPEASFFTGVPQAQGASQFAVPTPRSALLAGVGDLNGDGTVDDADLAVWRRRFGGQMYLGAR